MYSYKLNNSYTVYVDYTYINECIKICKGVNEKSNRKIMTSAYESMIVKNHVVKTGTKVYVLDLDTKEKVLFTIGNSQNVNPCKRIISDVSPVGRALLGHGVGETISICVPCGTLRYKILELRN